MTWVSSAESCSQCSLVFSSSLHVHQLVFLPPAILPACMATSLSSCLHVHQFVMFTSLSSCLHVHQLVFMPACPPACPPPCAHYLSFCPTKNIVHMFLGFSVFVAYFIIVIPKYIVNGSMCLPLVVPISCIHIWAACC